MENKKHLPLKIAYSILLAAEIILSIYTLAGTVGKTQTALDICITVAELLSLIFSFIYFALDYSKAASFFYKATMGLVTASQIFLIVNGRIQSSVWTSFLQVFALIFIVILFTAKNMGRNKTIIIAILLVLCKAGLFVFAMVSPFNIDFGTIITEIGRLLLADTVCIMACAKYADKAARGRD